MNYPNIDNIRMLDWIKIRVGWQYVGWIARSLATSTFEELVEKGRRSDHGELREVDIYPEGAACWMKEQDAEA